MAKATYGAISVDFNTPPFFSIAFAPHDATESAPTRDPIVFRPRRMSAGDHWLTPTTKRLLLETLALHGWATLSQLVAAIPAHPRPITAVRALLDRGLATLDEDRPFGADLVVRLPASAG